MRDLEKDLDSAFERARLDLNSRQKGADFRSESSEYWRGFRWGIEIGLEALQRLEIVREEGGLYDNALPHSEDEVKT